MEGGIKRMEKSLYKPEEFEREIPQKAKTLYKEENEEKFEEEQKQEQKDEYVDVYQSEIRPRIDEMRFSLNPAIAGIKAGNYLVGQLDDYVNVKKKKNEAVEEITEEQVQIRVPEKTVEKTNTDINRQVHLEMLEDPYEEMKKEERQFEELQEKYGDSPDIMNSLSIYDKTLEKDFVDQKADEVEIQY